MSLKTHIPKTGYYSINVIPQQSKTAFREVMADGTIKIALKATPEKGKANKELIRFLSDELLLSKEQIRISSGLTNRRKVVFVEFE